MVCTGFRNDRVRLYYYYWVYNNISLVFFKLLHIEPWPSHQSEILCTGWTCENKWKQSCGWTEMYGCYEMIYTDAHVRYRQTVWSQSKPAARRDPVSQGERQEVAWRPAGGIRPTELPTADLRLSILGREAEKVLNGALKITHRCMAKRRRGYRSVQQSLFLFRFISACLRLSLSYL